MLPLGLPLGLLGEGSQVGSCCCFLGRPRPRFWGAGAAGCPWAEVDGCPEPSPRALILPPAAAAAASATAAASAAARPPRPRVRPAPFGETGWRRAGEGRGGEELARAEGCGCGCGCSGCRLCHHQHRTSSGCQKERERGGGGEEEEEEEEALRAVGGGGGGGGSEGRREAGERESGRWRGLPSPLRTGSCGCWGRARLAAGKGGKEAGRKVCPLKG